MAHFPFSVITHATPVFSLINIILFATIEGIGLCNDRSGPAHFTMQTWAIIQCICAIMGTTFYLLDSKYNRNLYNMLDPGQQQKILDKKKPIGVYSWVGPRSGFQSFSELSCENQKLEDYKSYLQKTVQVFHRTEAIDNTVIGSGYVHPNNIRMGPAPSNFLPASNNNPRLKSKKYYLNNHSKFGPSKGRDLQREAERIVLAVTRFVYIFSGTMYFIHLGWLIYGTVRYGTNHGKICENVHIGNYTLAYIIISWCIQMYYPLATMFLIYLMSLNDSD